MHLCAHGLILLYMPNKEWSISEGWQRVATTESGTVNCCVHITVIVSTGRPLPPMRHILLSVLVIGTLQQSYLFCCPSCQRTLPHHVEWHSISASCNANKLYHFDWVQTRLVITTLSSESKVVWLHCGQKQTSLCILFHSSPQAPTLKHSVSIYFTKYRYE